MNFRTFGKTGRSVSEVGVGCWQFGGDWGVIDDSAAIATLQGAVDAGVNFFDTADVYGAGRSEELIGQFLSKSRADVFVATKLGRFGTPGGDANYTKEAFSLFVDSSLRRLGVEALDLVQLHCIPQVQMERAELWGWLDDLKRVGKIKAYGASVESDEDALLCMEQEGLESLQIIFNIFRQKPIATLFHNATMAQQALRWILDYPAVTTVIPGAKNAAMASANAVASDLAPLSHDVHHLLHEFYQTKVKQHIRGPY